MEAQFQTALDRLIETNSGAPSNTDVTNEMEQKEDMATHDPDDPHYYEDTKACQTSSAMFGSHDNGHENPSHYNTVKELSRAIISTNTGGTQEEILLSKSINFAEQHQEISSKQQPSGTTDTHVEVLASPINNQEAYCKRISERTVTIQQDPHTHIGGLHKIIDFVPVVESTVENSLEHWQEQIGRTSNKERYQKPQTSSR